MACAGVRRRTSVIVSEGHWRADSYVQPIEIGAHVIASVWKHRQTTPWAQEAGGQLFGSVSDQTVVVSRASGPYPKDERTRFGYRSDPIAAQEAIDNCSMAGMLYLGEWHTHAEDRPHPSPHDSIAMRQIVQRSTLNSSVLLLLIVGRRKESISLAMFSWSAFGSHLWRYVERVKATAY
ncbi:MAG TPA: Mov34/MPN/PAD-1 family protein [Terracidiphilus sp.]|nr:Mov34/MPN/PAD-1 family protein [Terracidiphilus sp.]